MANSPLYPNAGKMIRQEAAKAFRAKGVAKAMDQAVRSSGGGKALHRALQAFTRGVNASMAALSGSSLGHVAKQIRQYERGGNISQRRLIQAFLKSLGPVGELLGMIAAGGGAPSVAQAARMATKLMQAMGHEVTPARAKRRLQKPLLAAKDLMNALGEEPQEYPPEDEQAENPPRTPRSEVRSGGMGGLPPNHPVNTGEMQPAPESSNVYSFGYNSDSGNLYVRFRDDKTGGPGSLYRYSDTTPQEFVGMMAAASKGGWVWDHLRIRGTLTGHHKDYALVGIVGGYVPRKATMGPLIRVGQGWRHMTEAEHKAGVSPDYMGAIYDPRTKLTTQRNWVTSIRPLSPAYGGLDLGTDRTPNRGTPNNGRPRPPNRG